MATALDGAPTTTAPKGRFGSLDMLRGIALLAMASYHFSWDLEYFGYLEPGTVSHGLFKDYARLIAGTFILLAGLGLVLAHRNGIRWPGFWRRFAMIAAAAAAISIATYFIFPDAWIFFGILHSIAAMSLIGLLFLRLPSLLLFVLSAASLAAPYYLKTPALDAWYFWWTGLQTVVPHSNDYVPLFPWLGPFLAGIGIGKLVVAFGVPEPLRRPAGRRNVLAFAGRHSLSFYLLHQPVLIGVAYILSLVVPPAAADPVVGYVNSCQASCEANNDAKFCQAFCGCTVNRMLEQNLFTEFTTGKIDAKDQRIATIANECSLVQE
jgi:uncharacterized membrane protein